MINSTKKGQETKGGGRKNDKETMGQGEKGKNP